MKNQIFLLCFLFGIALVPRQAGGQQGQAMLKIVKSEDGTAKIFDLQGNEIIRSFTTAGEPVPVQITSIQTSREINSSNNSGALKEPGKPKTMVGTLHSNSEKVPNSSPGSMNPGPNLTVYPGSASWSFLPDQSQRISLTIVNDGTVTAGSSVLGFYISADLDFTTSDLKLGDLPVFSLPPGRQSVRSFTTAGDL